MRNEGGAPASAGACTKENLIAQVITLEKREDRRLAFDAMAAEHGLRYTWSPGMKGSTPAEGISAAHRAVVQLAKNEGLPYVLVMEDDAFFTAPGAYDLFLQNVPASFDLYLGGIYSGTPDAHGRVERFSGMHCYLVHARFYDTFLSVKPTDHIDYALSGLGDYVVCQPYTCMQRDGFSDNEQEHKKYSTWGKGKTYKGSNADNADGADERG